MKKLIIGYLLMGMLLIGGCGSSNAPENSVDAVGSSVESTETVGEDMQETSVASSGPAEKNSISSEAKDNKETGETKESGETKETGETKEPGETKEAGESKETAKATKQTDKGNANGSSSPSTQTKTTESGKSVGKASQESGKEESRSSQEYNNKNSGSSTPEPAHTSCTWDGGKVTTAAGCSSGGEKTYTCTVCGKTKTESIPASGHSMTTETTAPTCTAAGKSKTYCRVCGYVESETANGAATGHSYGEVTWFLPQTCTSTGYWNQVCTVCGDAIGGNGDSTLPHYWNDGKREGSPCRGYVTTYTCAGCGDQKEEFEEGGCIDNNSDGVCDNCQVVM